MPLFVAEAVVSSPKPKPKREDPKPDTKLTEPASDAGKPEMKPKPEENAAAVETKPSYSSIPGNSLDLIHILLKD